MYLFNKQRIIICLNTNFQSESHSMSTAQHVVEIDGASDGGGDEVRNGLLVEHAELALRVHLHAYLVGERGLYAHAKGNRRLHGVLERQLAGGAEQHVLVRSGEQRGVEDGVLLAARGRHDAALVAVGSRLLHLVGALVVSAHLASHHEVAHLRLRKGCCDYGDHGARGVLLSDGVEVHIRGESSGEILEAHSRFRHGIVQSASLRARH